MLCVEDALDGLRWADAIGGLKALKIRSRTNFETVARWVEQRDWVEFLAVEPAQRSTTSICLRIVAPWFAGQSVEIQQKIVKALTAMIADEGAGFDLASYRDAPPGLRIWGGATVEAEDIETLLPWLDWAYESVRMEYSV